jgi:hypothetical protein
MYGMVNEGIRSFIIKNYGEGKWREIATHANLKDQDFILLQIYSDKLTYDLVGSICHVLEITSDQALEAYGRYWISFAAGSGYENLLLMFGGDFRSCLHNLNHMHEHMGSFMTGIIAPSFHVVEESETEIKVDYFSKREGLHPFVLGLLYGLLDRYEQQGKVEYLGPSGEGHRFKINFT